MPEIKNAFIHGKMNKDLDERLIPNARNILDFATGLCAEYMDIFDLPSCRSGYILRCLCEVSSA